MANQKVKHIIAKLVGQSTESTLDVYDVDAVHTDKIANNLTTTSSGYVLDARQGKALNDSLTSSQVKKVGSAAFTDALRYSFAYVAGTGKSLNIIVPMPILNSASSVDTTSLTISLRTSSGGFLVSENADVTSLITATYLTIQGIIYVVNLTNAVTPNSIYVGSVKISCTFS